MGQIVKRKKKGRPSKADLAAERLVNSNSPANNESDTRRSLRRRNAKHGSIIDYDDYLDFYEDEIDIERGNIKKKRRKVKLVVKLPKEDEDERVESESTRPSEDDEDDAADADNNNNDNNYNDDKNDEERGGRKEDSKGQDSGPGTPIDSQSECPLPDKKLLELILDKLQKKDVYGVYAEPVDPEELPDYHDIIKKPMDFSTVRKKLGDGLYSNMEQFESDVFLICSNAMQYNAPDSIYYKQARTIQEMARKKFQKVRMKIERSEKDLKSEQRMKPNSLPKKQIKKSFCQTSQDPVGLDFSSGATLPTAGDFQNGPNPTQNGSFERPANVDGVVEGNSSVIDNIVEKVEELISGKGTLSKIGKKPIVHDENPRTTYNISNQPVVRSDSIFSTFESEHKQLVSVGLHAEHAYARSLARFAASVGPVAWKVASKRIEQALPANFKYGRGWVGEYEPLPTPILWLENPRQKVPAFSTNLQQTADLGKDDRNFNIPVSVKENPGNGPSLKGKQSSFISSNGLPTVGKTSSFGSSESRPITPVSNVYQQQNPLSRNHSVVEVNGSRQVELNISPTTNPNKLNLPTERQLTDKSEGVPASLTRKTNLVQSTPFRQQDCNGDVPSRLSNGKVINNTTDHSNLVSSSYNVSNQMATTATYFPHRHEQGQSIPLQLMKMSAAKVQNQQTSPRHPPVDSSSYSPHGHEQGPNNPLRFMRTSVEKVQNKQTSPRHSPADSPQVQPSIPSSTVEDPNNAAQTAARAWMSIGGGGFNKQTGENLSPRRHHISADSLYNPARELHPQVSRFHGENLVSGGSHFPAEKTNFPVQAPMPQHFPMANQAQVHNRPVVFPQLVTADLSRFQMQSPRQNFSPEPQPRKKQETLPPDLNIGFQLSGSPARQSSGVLVDSQQPDLALQL